MLNDEDMRRLLSVILLWIVMLPCAAQDDVKALGAAVDTIVRKYSHHANVVDDIVEDVYKKHKKNPQFITRIAKSYYSYFKLPEDKQVTFLVNDTARALKFIRRALEVDPKFGPAYLLAADLFAKEGQKEVAMEWYNRAISANPNDTAAFVARSAMLARDDVEGAIARLQEMKKNMPDYPVEIEVARLYRGIYEDSGGEDIAVKMIDWYDKVPGEQMTAGDMYWYALIMPTVEQMRAKEEGKSGKELQEALNDGFKKAANLLENGCARFPKNYGLNQLTMRYMVNVKRFDEALSAYNRMVAADNAKDEPANHYNLAQIYIGQRQFDKAEAELKVSETMEGATEKDAQKASGSREYILNLQIADLFGAKRFDEAITIWKEYMAKKKAEGKLSISIKDQYYSLLNNKASQLDSEKDKAEKIATFRQTDDVLKDMMSDADDTNTKTLLLDRRLLVARNLAVLEEDNDYVYRAALEQINMCEALPSAELTGGVQRRYAEACFRMCQYYTNKFINTNRSRADQQKVREYGNKVLDYSENAANINLVTQWFTSLKIK